MSKSLYNGFSLCLFLPPFLSFLSQTKHPSPSFPETIFPLPACVIVQFLPIEILKKRTSALFATLLVSLLSSSVYGSLIPVASDSNDSIQPARDIQSLEERKMLHGRGTKKQRDLVPDWNRDEEEAKRFNADWKMDEEAKSSQLIGRGMSRRPRGSKLIGKERRK
ncbi:hypothetical protein K435DRAFT_872280 [Dendrothele bispora CBS 962.96]|uniref:Uncharacterized protein n=1 Tax=Dendrothele bispora (strain CBS 962.96) TaxID=1314807 RepID=A0A4S8L202_DENBC|nr:hypothetical protein K435DRAFT_872280 [Dendrothele bispora CBS 962.96]